MVVRHLATATAIIGFLASPVAALAASPASEGVSQRSAAPIEQGNEMRSAWVIAFFAIAAIIAAIIIAASDDNDPVSP